MASQKTRFLTSNLTVGTHCPLVVVAIAKEVQIAVRRAVACGGIEGHDPAGVIDTVVRAVVDDRPAIARQRAEGAVARVVPGRAV